ncbi:MAG: hypothetical protein CMP65_02320 [Flavobacteriales bacterium]|nr:hypothetical protein [Flavobacteriales bacterium]
MLKHIFFIFFFIVFSAFADSTILSLDSLLDKRVISSDHAYNVSKLITLDNQGRIKPYHTVASELIRKISRKKELYNQNPTQIILGMTVDPLFWQMVPIIKVSDYEVLKILNFDKNLVPFVSFFSKNQYILTDYVNSAYSKKPIDRTKFDKKILEVDERVNICSMIFSGNFIKMFPSIDGEWLPDVSMSVPGLDSVKTSSFQAIYRDVIYDAIENRNWNEANLMLEYIKSQQFEKAAYILPSNFKVNLEIFYNEADLFGWSRLFLIYFLFGIFLLIFLLINIFYSNHLIKKIILINKIFISLGFCIHFFALIMRWYISGHAPWSNAYESVIFIAFATMIAGYVFTKKSNLSLSAACLVSAMLLVVANLNWLNPEITNLVPVLKSYWLMIHVSVITSSYGFFGLCAFLGFLNLVLIIINDDNKIKSNVSELTIINEQSMMIGLFLLTVGTFLGGVWANESWGRYWGWDPKETWALVSCIVYATILHVRLLKTKKYTYLFNLFALFGFSSILMTYFGVNYYLAGLHSYAAGDPFPIPSFVYPSLIFFFIVSIISYFRYQKWILNESE